MKFTFLNESIALKISQDEYQSLVHFKPVACSFNYLDNLIDICIVRDDSLDLTFTIDNSGMFFKLFVDLDTLDFITEKNNRKHGAVLKFNEFSVNLMVDLKR